MNAGRGILLGSVIGACMWAMIFVAIAPADTPPKHGISVGVLKYNYRGGHAAKAPLKSGPPTAPCTEEHILDIYIIDGVLYECSCDQRIFVDNDCEWQEITSQAEDPTRVKRIVKRTVAQHHRVIRIYAKPGVAA